MLEALWVDVVAGWVALLFAAGARRLLAPASDALTVSLHALGLALPPLVLLLTGLLPGLRALGPTLLRVGPCREVLAALAPGAVPVAYTLLAGVALLFAVQELGPALKGQERASKDRRARADGARGPARVPDAELTAEVERLFRAFQAAGHLGRRRRPPRALRLETDRPRAFVDGLLRPTIVVSRGLWDRLDPAAREGALAHELAHLAFGGNGRLMLLFALRALQAPSPAALVQFRALTTALEGACDALAARVTGRPADVAAALLAAHKARGGEARPTDVRLLEGRLRALLAPAPPPPPGRALGLLNAALLGGLLWGIS